MEKTHIICHYAEIAIKGANRKLFEKQLQDNIKFNLKKDCPNCVEKTQRKRGRIVIVLSETGQNNLPKIEEVLKEIFGLAYFAFATKVDADMEVMNKAAIEMLSELEFDSFRVTSRRADNRFLFGKQQMNEKIGAHIVETMQKKVNLDNPDATCFVDVLEDGAYFYTERISSSGGLPVGSSGKTLLMLSGGIDSPVAAYYTLKRGAGIVALHFHSVPLTNRASIEKAEETAELLQRYQRKIKLVLVELAPIQEQIMVKSPEKYRIVLYRRFMFRIAEEIAKLENAHAIVTGESLGQVASQTVENMEVIEEVTKIPILRPLIGFDKQEIVNVATRIGTYDISVQPDQDCCSLFVPKHPVTKAKLFEAQRAEEDLDVENQVKTAVENRDKTIIG